ncbi:MAG: hypothetical protein ACRD29_17385 [Acidimicrobiales bacterium]
MAATTRPHRRLLTLACAAIVLVACGGSTEPAAPAETLPTRPPVGYDSTEPDPVFPAIDGIGLISFGPEQVELPDLRCAFHAFGGSIDYTKPVFITGTGELDNGDTLEMNFRHLLDDGDAFGPGVVTSFEFVLSRDGQVIDRLVARGRVTDDGELLGTDGEPIGGVLVSFQGFGDVESEDVPMYRVDPDGAVNFADNFGRIQLRCDPP